MNLIFLISQIYRCQPSRCSNPLGMRGLRLCSCWITDYGFPIGVSGDLVPKLTSLLRNHGSSYQFYTHLDKFLSTGLVRYELAGTFRVQPLTAVHVSPLITAVKKPDGRRSVFDATFGDMSLNNCTPQDTYLDQPFTYDFPKIEDFKRFVLDCGRGCYLWKGDLSRYNADLYSGHSFRRGGATFLHSCGGTALVIQSSGDWSSQCFTRYLYLTEAERLQSQSLMARGINAIFQSQI